MSSSDDDLPTFNIGKPFKDYRSPSKKDTDNLLAQNKLLVQQSLDDIKYKTNILTKLNASEDIDYTVEEKDDHPIDSSEESDEQLPTCIFIKPKHLQYFSLNHLTLLKCGYESITDLSTLEQFLLTLELDEMNACICQAGVLDAIRNINHFTHFLLKTMSLHKNTVFIDSSVKLIKDLSTKPDVEHIQFSSGDIFQILFNCSGDVMQSEIMKMVPDLRIIPTTIMTCEDLIPQDWLFNLKSVLASFSELLQGCTISEEDLGQVFKCFLLVGVEDSSAIYSEVQKCLVATLKRIPLNSWPIHRSNIAMSLTTLTEDIPSCNHWRYSYSLVNSIPFTCGRGIELRQYISVIALLNLAALNQSLEYSNALFSILTLESILDSLFDIEESLQHIAIKFLNILIKQLKFEQEENETLCMLLKRSETSFRNKPVSLVQVQLVKMHTRVYSKLSKGIIGRPNPSNVRIAYQESPPHLDSIILQSESSSIETSVMPDSPDDSPSSDPLLEDNLSSPFKEKDVSQETQDDDQTVSSAAAAAAPVPLKQRAVVQSADEETVKPKKRFVNNVPTPKLFVHEEPSKAHIKIELEKNEETRAKESADEISGQSGSIKNVISFATQPKKVLSEDERAIMRAKRFNLTVEAPKPPKKTLDPAKRMRIMQWKSNVAASKPLVPVSFKSVPNLDVLKKRAEKFGENVSDVSKQLEDQEKIYKRKSTFGHEIDDIKVLSLDEQEPFTANIYSPNIYRKGKKMKLRLWC